MPMHITMWPDEVIELNRELASGLHWPLEELLGALPAHVDFAERLGHIAAYCELILDGAYDSNDIAGICGELVARLVKKRVRNPKDDIVVM